MSRVINPETAGKERMHVQRAILLAIRELTGQETVNSLTYDLIAFIVLSLNAITDTVDSSVIPWEKRGYWIKADRFRQEWGWTGNLAQRMRDALLKENWADVAMLTAQLASKLSRTKLPVRHGLGTPWLGAWNKLTKSP